MTYIVGWEDATGWHTSTYAVWTDAIGRVVALWRDPEVRRDTVVSWLEESVPAWAELRG